jgi:hypothetical protein
MQHYADRFDPAEQVRIVAAGTDLTLSIAGRSMKVDAGGANIPGGEFFWLPVEDSAEGEITFAEFPASLTGRDVVGVHLRFEGGKVVDASAEVNEEFLSRPSTPTRVRASWASSGSVATRGSRSTRATSCSTRRSTAPSTSRSGTASTTSAGRTSPPSTGTSSKTSARAAGSSSTASSCRRTGAG